MSSGRRGIQFASIADLQACMDLSARHLLMLCLVGGKQGLRGTAGLVFTFASIRCLYLPLVYRGCSPFWTAAGFLTLQLSSASSRADGVSKLR